MINIGLPSHDNWFWRKQFYPEGVHLFMKSDILLFQLTHRRLVTFIDFVNFTPILTASEKGFKVVKNVI